MCIWCGAYTELMSTLARRSSILTHLTLALQPVGYIDGRSPRGHSGELLVILVGASRVTRCWLVPGACISSSNITFIVSISSCLASLGDSGAIGLSNLARPPRWQLQSPREPCKPHTRPSTTADARPACVGRLRSSWPRLCQVSTACVS